MGIFHYHVYPRVRNIFNKIKEKIHDVFGCIYSQYQRKVWRLNAKSLPKRNISPTSRHISDIWCSFPPRWDMDTTFLGGYTYVYLHSYHIQIYIYIHHHLQMWSALSDPKGIKMNQPRGQFDSCSFVKGDFFPLDVPMTKITTISRKLQADFAVGNGKQNEISCRIFVRGFDFCHLKWSVCVYIYIVSDIYIYCR